MLLVGLAQLNQTVGDLAANAAAIGNAYNQAVAGGAEVVVFSELAVTGYPPEDLLLKPAFLRESAAALEGIAAATGRTAAIVGFPELADSGVVYNAAAVCSQGRVQAVVRKQHLPNYAVFDEQRYFTAATATSPPIGIAGVSVGISICEDIWGGESARGNTTSLAVVLSEQVAAGAELLVSLNASPYRRQKQADREQHIAAQASAAELSLIYVNQVGGQDELVFDGGSVVFDGSGEPLARLSAFEPAVTVVPVPTGQVTQPSDQPEQPAKPSARSAQIAEWPEPLAEIWQALVLATRDYVTKNGFTEVAVGVSGGIDSSLVTALAVDALGPEQVHAVSMPSRYSSDHSHQDAACLAANLGVDFRTVPIEPAHLALGEMLQLQDSQTQGKPGRQVDLTEQNLQSRIRGVILMGLSNRHGWLVLTTGNKTELSVGYSTLYGDTAGGYAVIKDCPKLLVYDLCRWRNDQTSEPWIPPNTLAKPPSAELSPGQLDEDHLPPYELLDPLVEGYVDGDLSTAELISQAAELGADAELVRRVTRLVDLAEYKRRQSPLGPRISAKSFGKDRRMPVTNRYS